MKINESEFLISEEFSSEEFERSDLDFEEDFEDENYTDIVPQTDVFI